jgi:hypothetical protein
MNILAGCKVQSARIQDERHVIFTFDTTEPVNEVMRDMHVVNGGMAALMLSYPTVFGYSIIYDGDLLHILVTGRVNQSVLSRFTN